MNSKIYFKHLSAIAALLALVACGGGGGGENDSKTSISYSQAYTAPTPRGQAPLIVLNQSLSTSTTAVFDVIGVDPTLLVKGVNLSLSIDTNKVSYVRIPGDSGITTKLGYAAVGNATLSSVTAGSALASGSVPTNWKAFAAGKLRDGSYEMASVIQGNGARSVPSNQVLLRFAVAIQGQPIEGVVNMSVGTTSGLFDANARVIPGTAPVVGRLEIKKS